MAELGNTSEIKDIIQDCNLNFLLGSGLSCPYLPTLGNMEGVLTQLEEMVLPGVQRKILKCSLYKRYFDTVMSKNLRILKSDPDAAPLLKAHCDFLTTINSILVKRKSTILSKEANIFTTNVDIFLDKALEDAALEYNDGFNGRFTPCFNLSNFKKSRFTRSLHYDNVAELPVFNLLKLHGALTWQLAENEKIRFSSDLSQVAVIDELTVSPGNLIDTTDDPSVSHLLDRTQGLPDHDTVGAFLASYDELLIVNPTKEKFKHSVLNHTYYEMLRLYANELEKENTVLFAIGFSFADEHIREITLRAAHSNPTLMIYIFAHSSASAEQIGKRLNADNTRNRNIKLIAPGQRDGTDIFAYDLPTITREVFRRILGPESGTEGRTRTGCEESTRSASAGCAGCYRWRSVAIAMSRAAATRSCGADCCS